MYLSNSNVVTVDTRIIFWQTPSYVRLIPETFGCKIVAPTQDLWQRSFLYLLVARTKLIVQKHCAGEEITEGWTVYMYFYFESALLPLNIFHVLIHPIPIIFYSDRAENYFWGSAGISIYTEGSALVISQFVRKKLSD